MTTTDQKDTAANLETRLQEAGKRLVAREVVYCVSSLVYTMAKAYGESSDGRGDLGQAAEQAMELSSPIPDYEEAATDAGWTGPHTDDYGATYFKDDSDGQTWACDGWEELCQQFDIEPYESEVYEHWIVSSWLADKLEAKGEKVDRDFCGLTVWARTTTGQAILLDEVIRDIVTEMGWHKDPA